MRIFYENYEKLKYWMYQEEVYPAMIQEPYFSEYRLEQCQQDLNNVKAEEMMRTKVVRKKKYRKKE